MATTNMGLSQPTPGTQGPDWANELNANASIIDAHDHSSGKGVPVTPSGLSINTDLTINENKIIDLKSVKFVSQTSSLIASDAADIYIKNGDLFYANGLTDVQITNGGSVAGASGNIAGLASPASATFAGQQYSFFYDAGTYADLRCRDLILSVNFGNTIKLTHAATSSYTLTLPASPPPASPQFMTLNSSGVVAVAASPTLGDTASILTWQGATQSGSKTTGSIVTLGGVGIGKTCWVGGSLITDSNCYVNGPLTVASGGAGITGGIAVTGNSQITGGLAVTTTLDAPGGVRTASNYMIQRTFTTNLDGTGRLVYTHGLGSAVIWDVSGWVFGGGSTWNDIRGYTALGQLSFNSTQILSAGNLPALAGLSVRLFVTIHN
jgi:hypothetical protein